jgi:adenylosuccinate lyase
MSEVVMLRLWQKTGKKVAAHTLIHDVAMEAFEQGSSLKNALLANAQVCRHLSPEEIDTLTNPETYYGDAPEQVDNVIAYVTRLRETD